MLDAQRTGSGGLAKLGEGVRANSDAKTQAGLGRGPNQSKKVINAAWTDVFPAQGATLDLDFANDRGFVRGVGQGKSMDAVTFTRASSGTYVKSDGTLGQHSNQGALGNNLLTFPQDFDNVAWTKTNSTVIANTEIAPDGILTADLLSTNSATSSHYIQSNSFSVTATSYTATIYAKKNTHRYFQVIYQTSGFASNSFANFDLEDGQVGTVGTNATASIENIGDGWFKCIVTATSGSVTVSTINFGLITSNTAARLESWTGTSAESIFIWGAQLELGSSATEYFPTNIGQPRFDWASTASTGAGTIADPYVIPLAANPTSNGLLIEQARTNRILWCRDATQANWVSTNVTAAKDQTGIDGVANAASSLTATANDGTCIQTITLASGSRTGSVYLKRITGTGNVQVSLDGSTWSTVDLSDTEWRRIVLSGTVTNPTVGIKLAVSGDAVAMDYGQVEDGGFVTSPILTTTASVTRSADFCQLPLATLKQFFPTDISWSQNALYGTFNFNFTRGNYPSSTTTYNYFVLNAGGGANEYLLVSNRADNGGTTNPTLNALTANIPTKIALAFDYRNQFEQSVQDERVFLDNSLVITGSLYNYDKLSIGYNGRTIPTYVPQCWIKQITYIPKVLNISQLQALTRGAT